MYFIATRIFVKQNLTRAETGPTSIEFFIFGLDHYTIATDILTHKFTLITLYNISEIFINLKWQNIATIYRLLKHTFLIPFFNNTFYSNKKMVLSCDAL